jgi:hypothetical protein
MDRTNYLAQRQCHFGKAGRFCGMNHEVVPAFANNYPLAGIHMRPIYITILVTVLHLLASAQDAALPVQESHDKTLKGGYIISFLEDNQSQYLYLSKGGNRIKVLSSTSKGLLRKNLGYVGADFQDFFVHSKR